MEITIDKNELYSFIKRAVKEALEEETLGLFLKNIPPISQEEMEDIEKRYGKPSSKKESVYSETIEI